MSDSGHTVAYFQHWDVRFWPAAYFQHWNVSRLLWWGLKFWLTKPLHHIYNILSAPVYVHWKSIKIESSSLPYTISYTFFVCQRCWWVNCLQSVLILCCLPCAINKDNVVKCLSCNNLACVIMIIQMLCSNF